MTSESDRQAPPAKRATTTGAGGAAAEPLAVHLAQAPPLPPRVTAGAGGDAQAPRGAGLALAGPSGAAGPAYPAFGAVVPQPRRVAGLDAGASSAAQGLERGPNPDKDFPAFGTPVSQPLGGGAKPGAGAGGAAPRKPSQPAGAVWREAADLEAAPRLLLQAPAGQAAKGKGQAGAARSAAASGAVSGGGPGQRPKAGAAVARAAPPDRSGEALMDVDFTPDMLASGGACASGTGPAGPPAGVVASEPVPMEVTGLAAKFGRGIANMRSLAARGASAFLVKPGALAPRGTDDRMDAVREAERRDAPRDEGADAQEAKRPRKAGGGGTQWKTSAWESSGGGGAGSLPGAAMEQ